MSGRRLLDVAAIYRASRGVASKYVALRNRHWENYSKTSSLTRAVKSQTDRVTLTVKAASALSERFNSTDPTYPPQAPPQSDSTLKTSIPSRESVDGSNQTVARKQGPGQDYFNQRSEGNSAAEPPPKSGLGVKQVQANRHPLPDGTIPPSDSAIDSWNQQDVFPEVSQAEPPKHPLSEDATRHDVDLKPASSGRTSIPDPANEAHQITADRARKIQRQAEKQIPSQSAGPPPGVSPDSRNEFRGQDIFHETLSETSQSLSSLPRVKLPKVTEDRQEGSSFTHGGQINPDVFDSSIASSQEHHVPQGQAVPEQEQLSEDMYSDIFQSPKVARMLGVKPKVGNAKEHSGLHVQQDAAPEQTKVPQDEDRESFSERPIAQDGSPSKARPYSSARPERSGNINEKIDDEDIDKLAADVAKDSDNASSVAPSVSFRKCYKCFTN